MVYKIDDFLEKHKLLILPTYIKINIKSITFKNALLSKNFLKNPQAYFQLQSGEACLSMIKHTGHQQDSNTFNYMSINKQISI